MLQVSRHAEAEAVPLRSRGGPRTARVLALRRTARFLGISLAAIWYLAPTQAQTRVSLPEWAGDGRCIQRGDGDVLVEQQRRELVFECPARGGRGDMVSCDFEGAEPVDVPPEVVCSTGVLSLQKAVNARVGVSGPVELTLEWLTVTRDGQLALHATRQVAAGGMVPVLVAPHEDRLIRFSRQGASPVTVRATDLAAREEWPLPDSVPGSELVVHIQAGVVLPELFRLSGPWLDEVRRDDRDLLALQDLPTGDYELVPIYAGGLEAEAQPVRLQDLHSTLVHVALEDVGAVEVAADVEICSEITDLQVTRLTTVPVGEGMTRRRVPAARVPKGGLCSQTIGGLTPGSYEIVAEAHNKTVSTQAFEVTSQAISSVRLDATGVYVSGIVLVNGRPSEHMAVEFTPDDSHPPEPMATARTDQTGIYNATLQRPGVYDVTFRRDGMPLLRQERKVTLTTGLNAIDWIIDGATLNVRFTGWDRTSPVDVVLAQVAPVRPGAFRTGTQVKVDATLPVTIEGLGFGTYSVQARQRPPRSGGPRKVSLREAVTLDEAQPEATVELGLAEYDGVLVLRDVTGQVVTGAIVLSGDAGGGPNRVPEVSPGNYWLGMAAAPGIELFIRAPGRAPLCVFAPAGGERTVAMDSGMPIRVVFSGYAGLVRPPGRLLWPGTECPVSLDSFVYTRVPTGQSDQTEFAFANFPQSNSVLFLAMPVDDWDGATEVSVEHGGTIHIRLPDVRGRQP